MYKHFIVISSSYSDGKRIAFHQAMDDNSSFEPSDIIKNIQSECGEDVSIAVHFLETESSDWISVVQKDSFFKDIEVIYSVSDFIDKIKKDRVLNGLDVAKYILSKVKCTHLKLEKLTYLCYADYLCYHNKKLFEDKIYAFQFGPVVGSVYEKFKYKGSRILNDDKNKNIEIDTDINIYIPDIPSRSRILFAYDGADKLSSIDETLSKYGSLSAMELVNLTHGKNTPWSFVDSDIPYELIGDDLIKKYHQNEKIYK